LGFVALSVIPTGEKERNMRRIDCEEDLVLMYRNSLAYAVIAAWSGQGLFHKLADGKARTVEDLQGDNRALAITAPVLAHLGLLSSDGSRYALSPTGKTLLEAGALSLDSAERTHGDLSRFDRVLAEGGPARAADGSSRVSEGGVREHDPEGARAFMKYLYRRSERSVVEVARWLMPRLPEQPHILDLGGGHGRYGHELTRHGAEVTLYDRDLIVDIARERYSDSLQYISGDFMTDPLGGPYQAALLSNIVHGLGPDENRTLFARLADSLAPGGLVVLKDMFLNEDRCQPEEAALFGLTMLMYTREGQSYTPKEMEDLAGPSGFENIGVVSVRNLRFSLVFLQKTG
tara:strand:+ start:375 stop:1412 length:1038 start_codon:yes stop_codon:yes gene_type:complete